MAKRALFIGIALSGLLIGGCSFSGDQNPSKAVISNQTLAIAVAFPSNPADSLVLAVVCISATDMDSIVQPLTLDAKKAYGTVENIPLGFSRHVEIKICNKNHITVYYGDAYADVLSDKPVNLSIVLKHINGTIVINGTIQEDTSAQDAFPLDSGTVFLAGFNNSLLDAVSKISGTLDGGAFVKSLFGTGIKFDTLPAAKTIYRFPAINAINLSTGSMEALCYADTVTSDFTHIIDKSWLYGITAYNGKLAINFGQGWWYSGIALPLKKWIYICGSFDGSSIRLYLNGELVDSSSYTGLNGDSSYELGIGNATASSHNVPFIGVIDEIRISKTVRSAQEIAKVWFGIENNLK